jgi:hypothetical protein
MSATRRDSVRAPGKALDLPQLDALLKIYREALGELRSWRDPRVATLIVKLEILLLNATRDRRYLIEKQRTASLL